MSIYIIAGMICGLLAGKQLVQLIQLRTQEGILKILEEEKILSGQSPYENKEP